MRLAAEVDTWKRTRGSAGKETDNRAKADVVAKLMPVYYKLGEVKESLEGSGDDEVVKAAKSYGALRGNLMAKFAELKMTEMHGAVGQKVSSGRHEAVSYEVATDEFPAGTIVSEVETGYDIGGNVVVRAKVVESKAEEAEVEEVPEEEAEGEEEEGGGNAGGEEGVEEKEEGKE
jgi:molecular chaperone GrpE (heat shock protein)